MTLEASFGTMLLTSSPSILAMARDGVFSKGFGVEVPGILLKSLFKHSFSLRVRVNAM